MSSHLSISSPSSGESLWKWRQAGLPLASMVHPWHVLPSKEEHRPARATLPAPLTPLDDMVGVRAIPKDSRINPRSLGITPPSPPRASDVPDIHQSTRSLSTLIKCAVNDVVKQLFNLKL